MIKNIHHMTCMCSVYFSASLLHCVLSMKYCVNWWQLRNPDSAACILTTLWAGQYGIQTLAETNNFSLLQNVQTHSGAFLWPEQTTVWTMHAMGTILHDLYTVNKLLLTPVTLLWCEEAIECSMHVMSTFLHHSLCTAEYHGWATITSLSPSHH